MSIQYKIIAIMRITMNQSFVAQEPEPGTRRRLACLHCTRSRHRNKGLAYCRAAPKQTGAQIGLDSHTTALPISGLAPWNVSPGIELKDIRPWTWMVRVVTLVVDYINGLDNSIWIRWRFV